MIKSNETEKTQSTNEESKTSPTPTTNVLIPVQLTVLVPVKIPAIYSDDTFNGVIHDYQTIDPNEHIDELQAALESAVDSQTMSKVIAEIGLTMYRIREVQNIAVEAKLSTCAGVKEEEDI